MFEQSFKNIDNLLEKVTVEAKNIISKNYKNYASNENNNKYN